MPERRQKGKSQEFYQTRTKENVLSQNFCQKIERKLSSLAFIAYLCTSF